MKVLGFFYGSPSNRTPLLHKEVFTYKLLDNCGGIILDNKKVEWSSKIVATFPYN